MNAIQDCMLKIMNGIESHDIDKIGYVANLLDQDKILLWHKSASMKRYKDIVDHYADFEKHTHKTDLEFKQKLLDVNSDMTKERCIKEITESFYANSDWFTRLGAWLCPRILKKAIDDGWERYQKMKKEETDRAFQEYLKIKEDHLDKFKDFKESAKAAQLWIDSRVYVQRELYRTVFHLGQEIIKLAEQK